MRSVAEGFVLGTAASAQVFGFLGRNGEFYRGEFATLVRSIAKWLVFRFAASAPVVVAGLEFDCKGAFLDAYAIAHIYSFQ
jgi:hypothetical protein